jgi:hypothetical protein
LTLQQFWIKSGFRYGLSYLVVSIVCAILIVIGNDLLVCAAYEGDSYGTILQLDYCQWLPVCALALAFAFGAYLLFSRLLFKRLPVIVSALLCGGISCATAVLAGISPSSLQQYGWYEWKNLSVFFIAGFAFVWFAELMD